MCLVPIFIPINPDDLPDFDPPEMKWWKWLIVLIVFLIGFIGLVSEFVFSLSLSSGIFPIGLIVWGICMLFCFCFPIIFDESE